MSAELPKLSETLANSLIDSAESKSSCCSSANTLIDKSKRNFLTKAGCFLAGVGGAYALLPLFGSLMPNAKTMRAVRPLQVDLSHLQPGEMLTVEWNNQPIFILRRTLKMMQDLQNKVSELRDPLSLVDQQPSYAKNIYRSINPEFAVLVGICTHLGCVPQYQENIANVEQDGFYCPCHGSCFDSAGRVFKNVPAPINLAVPPYHFLKPHVLVIGESA